MCTGEFLPSARRQNRLFSAVFCRFALARRTSLCYTPATFLTIPCEITFHALGPAARPPAGTARGMEPTKPRLNRALKMIVRTFSRLLAVVGFVLAATAAARADSPWSNLLTINHVEADASKDYRLKEEQGPWIIMACSFSGPTGEKQAHELALELRQRYRMEAYVHHMDFKLDDPNSSVQSIFASPHRHIYHKVTESPDDYSDGQIKETAVVVGNFSAIDDCEAQRTLAKLKAADPDCLNPKREKEETRSLAWWRSIQAKAEAFAPKEIEGRKLNGPLSRAFITRNPLLPDEYFVPKTGLDELVVKMNKNVKFSLLDCPGKYTVQVAHFTGEVILNQGEIRAIESGSRPGPESTKQGLAQAAENAHELTEALRLKGWEAYEFHDRNESIVTVGSFDSVGAAQPDGQVQYSPQVHQIVESFGIQQVEEPGKPMQFKMRSCIGIFFDAQPIPIEVPRRSISRQLGQRLETASE
jgi:hypothetical protein